MKGSSAVRLTAGEPCFHYAVFIHILYCPYFLLPLPPPELGADHGRGHGHVEAVGSSGRAV